MKETTGKFEPGRTGDMRGELAEIAAAPLDAPMGLPGRFYVD